jgi:MoxR-like ATPase
VEPEPTANATHQPQLHLMQDVLTQIRKVIVGQDALVERLLIALLADGHMLLEGVPGLAKTLLVKTAAQAIQAQFSRIQFTPDLLPADLLGTQIYNPRSGDFSIHKGPIFANLVLADEINRSPAKVQSALLEAMQERQVTIGGQTFPLDPLFMVLATQNPIEQEGTYPLPEAQVDRFMFKTLLSYPSREEERLIIQRMSATATVATALESVQPVLTPQQLVQAREAARQVYVDDKITGYVLDLVTATRNPNGILADLRPYIAYGASPRAGISLVQAARALAFLRGRSYVSPDDVRHNAADVLRHRILVTYEADIEGITSEDIVQRILDQVPVP